MVEYSVSVLILFPYRVLLLYLVLVKLRRAIVRVRMMVHILCSLFNCVVFCWLAGQSCVRETADVYTYSSCGQVDLHAP